MLKKNFFVTVLLVAAFVGMGLASAYAAEGKTGYVDLRKAFYEYGKTKTFETQLNDVTAKRETERAKQVEVITKLRDEINTLQGEMKNTKQAEADAKIAALQTFDTETRQQLLTKKNDMFKEVIDDIQKIVENIGKAGGYDFVLDSRNIMYGKPEFDLTNQVITQLNGAAPAAQGAKAPAQPAKPAAPAKK